MTNLTNDVNDFARDVKSLNVLILGKVGVGKSSLINAVFGDNVAITGSGFPITSVFEKYLLEVEGLIPIALYDSAGCELGESNFLQSTNDFLNTQLGKGTEEQIHIAWYVISASSARFEEFEGEVINKLYEKRVPVIIILSQCDRARRSEIDGIKKAINSLDFKKVYNIVEVSALPLDDKEPFGLDSLVETTTKLLPKILGDAFIAVQVVNIRAKRTLALALILTAAASCFAAGFVPIPFLTPAAALTSQTILWKQIAALYGLDRTKGMSTIWNQIFMSKEAAFTFAATTIADLFAWTGFGAFIAGGTAATYTVIVGLALTETFEELAVQELDGVSVEEIERLLQELFRKNFNKYKDIRITSKNDLDKIKGDFL